MFENQTERYERSLQRHGAHFKYTMHTVVNKYAYSVVYCCLLGVINSQMAVRWIVRLFTLVLCILAYIMLSIDKILKLYK